MTDILDLIDGAIADCTTSADAMRWAPEPIEPVAEEVPTGGRWTVFDETHLWVNGVEFASPTHEEVARIFDVPAELLDPDSPPRGIISALPQVPPREPDLLADLIALYRLLRERP